MRLAAWLAALGLSGGVVLRVASALGLGDTALTVPVLGAFPLLVAAAAAVLVVLAGASLVRDELRAPAALLTVAACIGVVIVAPARTARAQPASEGETITVATVNLRRGAASPAALTRLVAEEDPDLLVTTESTESFRDGLATAGALSSLPSRTNTRAGYSYAIGDLEWRWVSAGDGGIPDLAWTLPGGQVVEVTTVHLQSPIGSGRTTRWRERIAGIRPPSDRPGIVVGDFNATLDHSSMRQLLTTGWRDAADEVGRRLAVTYDGIGGRSLGLPMALDHVLVSPGIAVEEVWVRDLPGTDHRMLVARLRLPADA